LDRLNTEISTSTRKIKDLPSTIVSAPVNKARQLIQAIQGRCTEDLIGTKKITRSHSTLDDIYAVLTRTEQALKERVPLLVPYPEASRAAEVHERRFLKQYDIAQPRDRLYQADIIARTK
jgi:hypothetical protein